MKYKSGEKDKKYEYIKNLYLTNSMTLRNICKEYHIDRHSFSNFLKKQNISTRKKISSDDCIFEKIDNEEKAYWLGFLYADGSITYRDSYPTRYCLELGLKKDDVLHIDKFKSFMKSQRPINFRLNTNSYKIMILSKKLCVDLIKLGCYPKKSLTLKFPTEQNVPNFLIRHFLRGYFDGDGCIQINYKNQLFKNCSILGTKEFLESMLVILNLEKKVILKKDKRHLNNTYYIQFNLETSYYFLNLLYYNNNISLQRKQDKYEFAVKCRNILNYKGVISVKGVIPNTEINLTISKELGHRNA